MAGEPADAPTPMLVDGLRLLVPRSHVFDRREPAGRVDADYRRLNALILRNRSTINFLDRCAATVPIQQPGDAPVGLMIYRRARRRSPAAGGRARRRAGLPG